MNARGNLGDGLFILVQLFTFAISCFVALQVISAFANSLTGLGESSDYIFGTLAQQSPQVFDLWFATLFIGAPLVSAALAYFNAVPPFFYFLSVGYSLLQVVVGKALEIAYTSLSSTPAYAAITPSIPITHYILSNFGLYSYLVIVIVALGTFAKLNNSAVNAGFGQ